jgi:hypothetical protein
MALKRKPSPKRKSRKSRKSIRRKPSPRRKSPRRKSPRRKSSRRKSPRRNRGGMNTSPVRFKVDNYYQQQTNQYKKPIPIYTTNLIKPIQQYPSSPIERKKPISRYVIPTQIRPLPPKSKSSTRTNKQKDPVFYTDLYLLNKKFPLELPKEFKK